MNQSTRTRPQTIILEQQLVPAFSPFFDNPHTCPEVNILVVLDFSHLLHI